MSDQVIFLRDHVLPLTDAEQRLRQTGDSTSAVATVLDAHVEGLRDSAGRLAAASMAWSAASHREAEMAHHCRRIAGRVDTIVRLLRGLQDDLMAVQRLPTVPSSGGTHDDVA
jgi:hypothetical protein